MPKGKSGPRPNDPREPTQDICKIHPDAVLADGAACYQCEKDAIEKALSGGTAPVENSATEHGPNGHAKAETIYQCYECNFNSPHLPEILKHSDEMNHTYDETQTEKQSELFGESGLTVRILKVKLSEEELLELHRQSSEIVMKLDDEEQALKLTKDKIKALTTMRQELAAELRDPFKHGEVQCEWQISLETNSKTLVRLDSGEVVDTKALSAEDLAKELDRVQAANQEAAGTQ